MKEPEVVHAGSAGEVDDFGQPVSFDVARRHVSLFLCRSASVSASPVVAFSGLGCILEMPEHDAGAAQHLDRRRRPVLYSNHDP